jgi:plastocyanin
MFILIARPRVAAVAIAAVSASVVSACSFESAESSTQVFGTNDSCEMASDDVQAGKSEFRFTNNGDDVSELYVLLPNGDVLGEVENVTSGTTRTMTVDLVAGDYQIRCKPGQQGEGFTTDFSVTGEGGTPLAVPDREVAVSATDFKYVDLDMSGISAGNTIRFEMSNGGQQPHEFEVLDPKGEAIGEVASTEAGESRGATMTFEQAGEYSYQCILVDEPTGKKHTALGMSGTFDVAAS